MDIIAGLSGLLIGAVIAWQLAQGLAAAEMSRLRARMHEQVRHWQEETERARASAARISEETAAWAARLPAGPRGCPVPHPGPSPAHHPSRRRFHPGLTWLTGHQSGPKSLAMLCMALTTAIGSTPAIDGYFKLAALPPDASELLDDASGPSSIPMRR